MATIKRIKTIFQFRRDKTENWELNKDVVPASGEPCYDVDLKTLRIGDGKTTYENLPVFGNSSGGDDNTLQAEIQTIKMAMEAMQEDVDAMEEQVGETDVVEVQENVTNLITQMETTKTEMIAVQQTLDMKVDAEAVEELEESLKTYINEQIQNIETANTDYGEI